MSPKITVIHKLKERRSQVAGKGPDISPASRRKQLLRALPYIFFLLASAMLGVMDLFFGTGQYRFTLLAWIAQQPLLVLLNLLPYLLCSLFLWLLIGRMWIAFGLTGILCMVHAFATYWKLMARSEPVYGSDLLLIREAVEIGSDYISVPPKMVISVLFVIICTVILFFAARLLKLNRIRCRIRLPISALVLCLCALLFLTVYSSRAIYNAFPVWDQLNSLLESTHFISKGSMYPFLNSLAGSRSKTTDLDAETILADYENDDIPEEQKVSVICFMLEAYSDLSEYTDAITGTDPYEALHALEQESYHGRLVTNIFGGGTINTERSFVTGFCNLTEFQTPSWSYARYFAEQGYSVSFAHPGEGDFYDRRTVNTNLGFPVCLFREDCYDTGTEWYMDDIEFMPAVANRCRKEIKAGNHVFSMNVTYQNHGPYSTEYRAFSDDYVPQGDMDDDSYMIINNYLYGVQQTSIQLLALADSFRDSEEPVVLVFFGDHKPWLGDQSEQYTELGIDFNENSEAAFYNYYCTDYVIWANDAAKQTLNEDFTGTGPDISPCFLMNELFRLCGWSGCSWTKLTDEVMDALPVVTSNEVVKEDGHLQPENTISASAETLLEKMRCVQAYLSTEAGIHASASSAG